MGKFQDFFDKSIGKFDEHDAGDHPQKETFKALAAVFALVSGLGALLKEGSLDTSKADASNITGKKPPQPPQLPAPPQP